MSDQQSHSKKTKFEEGAAAASSSASASSDDLAELAPRERKSMQQMRAEKHMTERSKVSVNEAVGELREAIARCENKVAPVEEELFPKLIRNKAVGVVDSEDFRICDGSYGYIIVSLQRLLSLMIESPFVAMTYADKGAIPKALHLNTAGISYLFPVCYELFVSLGIAAAVTDPGVPISTRKEVYDPNTAFSEALLDSRDLENKMNDLAVKHLQKVEGKTMAFAMVVQAGDDDGPDDLKDTESIVHLGATTHQENVLAYADQYSNYRLTLKKMINARALLRTLGDAIQNAYNDQVKAWNMEKLLTYRDTRTPAPNDYQKLRHEYTLNWEAIWRIYEAYFPYQGKAGVLTSSDDEHIIYVRAQADLRRAARMQEDSPAEAKAMEVRATRTLESYDKLPTFETSSGVAKDRFMTHKERGFFLNPGAFDTGENVGKDEFEKRRYMSVLEEIVSVLLTLMTHLNNKVEALLEHGYSDEMTFVTKLDFAGEVGYKKYQDKIEAVGEAIPKKIKRDYGEGGPFYGVFEATLVFVPFKLPLIGAAILAQEQQGKYPDPCEPFAFRYWRTAKLFGLKNDLFGGEDNNFLYWGDKWNDADEDEDDYRSRAHLVKLPEVCAKCMVRVPWVRLYPIGLNAFLGELPISMESHGLECAGDVHYNMLAFLSSLVSRGEEGTSSGVDNRKVDFELIVDFADPLVQGVLLALDMQGRNLQLREILGLYESALSRFTPIFNKEPATAWYTLADLHRLLNVAHLVFMVFDVLSAQYNGLKLDPPSVMDTGYSAYEVDYGTLEKPDKVKVYMFESLLRKILAAGEKFDDRRVLTLGVAEHFNMHVPWVHMITLKDKSQLLLTYVAEAIYTISVELVRPEQFSDNLPMTFPERGTPKEELNKHGNRHRELLKDIHERIIRLDGGVYATIEEARAKHAPNVAYGSESPEQVSQIKKDLQAYRKMMLDEKKPLDDGGNNRAFFTNAERSQTIFEKIETNYRTYGLMHIHKFVLILVRHLEKSVEKFKQRPEEPGEPEQSKKRGRHKKDMRKEPDYVPPKDVQARIQRYEDLVKWLRTTGSGVYIRGKEQSRMDWLVADVEFFMFCREMCKFPHNYWHASHSGFGIPYITRFHNKCLFIGTYWQQHYGKYAMQTTGDVHEVIRGEDSELTYIAETVRETSASMIRDGEVLEGITKQVEKMDRDQIVYEIQQIVQNKNPWDALDVVLNDVEKMFMASRNAYMDSVNGLSSSLESLVKRQREFGEPMEFMTQQQWDRVQVAMIDSHSGAGNWGFKKQLSVLTEVGEAPAGFAMQFGGTVLKTRDARNQHRDRYFQGSSSSSPASPWISPVDLSSGNLAETIIPSFNKYVGGVAQEEKKVLSTATWETSAQNTDSAVISTLLNIDPELRDQYQEALGRFEEKYMSVLYILQHWLKCLKTRDDKMMQVPKPGAAAAKETGKKKQASAEEKEPVKLTWVDVEYDSDDDAAAIIAGIRLDDPFSLSRRAQDDDDLHVNNDDKFFPKLGTQVDRKNRIADYPITTEAETRFKKLSKLHMFEQDYEKFWARQVPRLVDNYRDIDDDTVLAKAVAEDRAKMMTAFLAEVTKYANTVQTFVEKIVSKQVMKDGTSIGVALHSESLIPGPDKIVFPDVRSILRPKLPDIL